MADLLQNSSKETTYTAKDIEVLEGLEPVRKRPGMYIGGVDEHAYHHLAAEVLDNAMDEAIAGHASEITISLQENGFLVINDNGRGIPVDPHPKFPDKSALEVILTTLHSGGKFGGNAYKVSGGLHGVGISVVNALSEKLIVEVTRNNQIFRQEFSRGLPVSGLTQASTKGSKGTRISFLPDVQIFGPRLHFKPWTLFRLARSKAYLFKGIRILWQCAPSLIQDETPEKALLHFPGGLADFLEASIKDKERIIPKLFAGEAGLAGGEEGKLEWAIAWVAEEEGFCHSYCNTIATPEGGTHEQGLRNALSRSLKAFGEMVGNKKVGQITPEDILNGATISLSLFIREPQFQGQTKQKLMSLEAARLVEATLKDRLDHWLSADKESAKALLNHIINRAEERLRKRELKEMKRQSATKRLRLPGKLADCSRSQAKDTEIFLVEGDSAGGSAKQARERETQAILPLRGKILNVASATNEKLRANQELRDLAEALGCGLREEYEEERLRYEKVIIMTDADVDGAHIASLLMTFFYQEIPQLIEAGHLYLALPPLYRLTHGQNVAYAHDDAHKEELLKKQFKGKKEVEISRFKGLGEMPPKILKDTTMNPKTRKLLRVRVAYGHGEEQSEERKQTAKLVETLMGKKPEARFQFIQENARFVEDIDL